jgi:uncharacterized SAM-binding protein YcdF (DUF218 family)
MTTLAFNSFTPMRRLATVFGVGATCIVLGFAAGFAWFIHLAGVAAPLPSRADGIVAFTGGADRVETALRLLNAGRADRLLLSGIGGGAELGELAHLAGVQPAPLTARVTLGRIATTTRGNALETAAWVQANGIHSLIVVTAYYHMPRALAELGRVLPDVALYPLAVTPTERVGRVGVPLRLLAEEYVKFIATTLGITTMLPLRDPVAPHTGHAG